PRMGRSVKIRAVRQSHRARRCRTISSSCHAGCIAVLQPALAELYATAFRGARDSVPAGGQDEELYSEDVPDRADGRAGDRRDGGGAAARSDEGPYGRSSL